jgi:CRP-like cAMP-binding protein
VPLYQKSLVMQPNSLSGARQNAFVQGFKSRSGLNDHDLEILASLCRDPTHVARGTVLLPDIRQRAILVLDGYCGSYKTLLSGRQVIFDFKVSGDVACLRNVMLGKSCQNLMASTDAVVCLVPRKVIEAAIDGSQALKTAFLDRLDDEFAHLSDRFTRLARGNALESTASLLLNIWERLKTVGQATNMSFPFHITQDDMADALGLTPVHVNRTLRQLRMMNVVTVSVGFAMIHDLETLRGLAQL